jgi:hypothetical protein
MFLPHALRRSARRIQLVMEVSTVVTESHRLSGGTFQDVKSEDLLKTLLTTDLREEAEGVEE